MSPIKSIIHNCKRATFLIEKKLIDSLTLREKVELLIHLSGCSVCRVFNKQSRLVNKMVQQFFKSSNDIAIHLPKGFKETLNHRIEEEINKS